MRHSEAYKEKSERQTGGPRHVSCERMLPPPSMCLLISIRTMSSYSLQASEVDVPSPRSVLSQRSSNYSAPASDSTTEH